MVKFDPSKNYNSKKKRNGPSNNRGSRNDRSSRDRSSSRGPSRDRSRSGGRSEFTKTKVICSACGIECEVPFKPTSDKPMYCDDCFSERNKKSSGASDKQLEIINEKLDKIMKALKIE